MITTTVKLKNIRTIKYLCLDVGWVGIEFDTIIGDPRVNAQ